VPTSLRTRLIRTGAVAVLATTGLALSAPPASAADHHPPVPSTAVSPHTGVDWSASGFGPGNTDANPSETAITAATVASLQYSSSIVSPVVRDSCMRQDTPVIAGGRIFLTDEGGFAAYDETTHAQLWSDRADDPTSDFEPTLTVSGNTLLAGYTFCDGGNDAGSDIAAYDVTTGAKLWEHIRDAPLNTMVADAGVVVVYGDDPNVIPQVTAYKISDGSVVWSKNDVSLDNPVSSGGRTFLTNTEAAGGFAVNIATGKTIWSTTQNWSIEAASVDGHRMLMRIGTDLVNVYGQTGGVAWTAPGMAGPVAVDANHVYVGNGYDVTSLNETNGKTAWSEHLTEVVQGPALAGGVLYLATVYGGLLELDATNGTNLDPDAPEQGVIGHPVIVNGRLYVTDGRILDVYTPQPAGS
jgi:outer membrane protein assembly factor BamB